VVLVPSDLRARSFGHAAVSALETFARVTGNPHARPLSDAEKAALLPDADAVVTYPGEPGLTRQLLQSAPRLRAIGVLGHSVAAANPRAADALGIAVLNTADAHGRSVAELALGLILSCLREIPQLDRVLRAGGWHEAFPLTRDLYGKTVGLVGFGAIARLLVGFLRPFECRLLASDPYVAAADAAALGVALTALDDLLSRADVVSIHAGGTAATHRLIGARELGRLRDGAVLVNTARGRIIDEAALIAELRRGRIAAGLDVFAVEPLPGDSELRRLPNVILTPHAGGWTKEMFGRRALALVEDLRRVLAGEQPLSRVTLDQALRHSPLPD
jgi:phosphoglycerate dehydrogenase-like enzyme